MSWLLSLPGDAVAQGGSILLAALGGLASDAAGVLNTALEGFMSLGAFVYALVAPGAGAFAGNLAAAGAACLLAASIVYTVFRLRADIFVAGLAANLLVQGGVALLSWRAFGTKGVVAFPELLSPRLDPGPLAELPVIGALLAQRPSNLLLFALAALLWLLLEATPLGLRLRAAGQREEALALAGVNPARTRFLAFAISGIAAAVAGAALSAQTGAWVPGATSGRGWIALVAVYLGRRKPGGTVAASLGFAALFAASNGLQSFDAPPELVLALPYLATALLVLAGKARLPRLRPRDEGPGRDG